MIPILDLTLQNAALQPQLDNAILGVVHSGQYILGKTVADFELAMADWLTEKAPYLDTRPHVISCANGSDALYLALKALNIGAGDEVITTPFTYIATSESILRAGAKPVFVDIEPDTFNLDVTQLHAKLTPATRAIMPVHLFGRPANMQAVMTIARQQNLKVIEDCAQAIGAMTTVDGQLTPVGLIGDIGCFSFFPSKNLGAFGDGGMCVTQDAAMANTLGMMRVHGSRERYYHEISGINSRLDALQAAVLSIKLPHLNGYNAQRQQVAERYCALLDSLSAHLVCPQPVDATQTHVYHQFTVRLKEGNRQTLLNQLQQAGVQTMIYYPVPAYRQPSHSELNSQANDFPVCETVSQQVFSLPMFPELSEAQQVQVVNALTQALTLVAA
jgi:dTDP-4-amino-4,6-dideoxygalactose transaminase